MYILRRKDNLPLEHSLSFFFFFCPQFFIAIFFFIHSAFASLACLMLRTHTYIYIYIHTYTYHVIINSDGEFAATCSTPVWRLSIRAAVLSLCTLAKPRIACVLPAILWRDWTAASSSQERALSPTFHGSHFLGALYIFL